MPDREPGLEASGTGAGDDALRDTVPSEPLYNARYDRIRLLGRGGFGEVWLAKDMRFADRPLVALKRLREDRIALEGYLADEITNLGAVQSHPLIPRVYDFDRGPHGEPYFTMDYIDGVSLETIRNEEPPLAEKRALDLLQQLLDVIDHIRDKGIVHRDLKPGNIMVTERGTANERPFVIDFGVARRTNQTREIARATAFQQDGFKPAELLAGRSVSDKTDLGALGLIAARLLTDWDLRGPAADAVKAAPRLAGDLRKFVLDLLEVRPEDRPSTAVAIRRVNRMIERRLPLWQRIGRSKVVRVAAVGAVLAAAVFAGAKQRCRFLPCPIPLSAMAVDQNGNPVENLGILAAGSDDLLNITNSFSMVPLKVDRRTKALRLVDRRTPPCYLCDDTYSLNERAFMDGITMRVQRVCDMTPRTQSIAVDSRPQGARISIDEQPTGKRTPYRFANIPPGSRKVRLELRGYKSEEVSAEVKPKEDISLTIDLNRVPPEVYVASFMPLDSDVLLDGEPLEAPLATATVRLLPGPHTFSSRGIDLTYTVPEGDPHTALLVNFAKKSIKPKK